MKPDLENPLYMPAGSVRSILALIIVSGYLFGYVTEDITIIVLGFYFISREGGKDN